METYDKEHLEVYRHRDSLQSQLKQADSKAVRFAEWLLKNTYYGITDDGRIKYHYPKTKDTPSEVFRHNYKYTTEQLFEIFENQSK